MKVQVFIPTFNRADRLRAAVSSVLAQTFCDLDVVVLDNHSGDHTCAVMDEIMAADSRVRHVRRDENIGMIGNYNSIAGLVDGDYFAVLADDDQYYPCFVATALAHFVADPRVKFVACNALTVSKGQVVKRQLDHWREGFYPANSAVAKCVLGHYPLITNCLFASGLRADFFFHAQIGNVGDGFLLAQLFSRYDAYVSKTVTGVWNNDGDNASSLQQFDAVLLVDTAVHELRLYEDFASRHPFARGVLLLVKLKLYLTILVAANRSSLSHVRVRSIMRDRVGPWALAMIWLLDKVKLIRLGLWGLRQFRKINIAWVARSELSHRAKP